MDPIAPPGYSRADITVGIAHFGVGNFHRAHEAVFLHELFARGVAREWGICGIGVLPGDARMRDALVRADYGYTHVVRHADGQVHAQRIASIVDFLFAPDDPEAVLALLASPQIRIVSLTITEGGYNSSGSAVFELVVEALARRRVAGTPPFTVVSCDNLQGNGHVARRAFVSFASRRDAELGQWVDQHVRFPNSMVDRITPVTSDQDRQFVAERFGATDPWPVLSEQYRQWVIEESFTLGRPPLESVGVEIVADVAPYEKVKLRVLNASHQALTYFGLLLGYEFVHEAASDPLIVRLLERYLAEEAGPTLDAIAGFDIDDYGRTAVGRFRNPHIRDTLARIATDASDRIPAFLLPVVLDADRAGRPAPLAAAVVASWAQFARARPDDVVDRRRPLVEAAVREQQRRPAGFLADERLTGAVGESPAFVAAFTSAYELISRDGARAALTAIVG